MNNVQLIISKLLEYQEGIIAAVVVLFCFYLLQMVVLGRLVRLSNKTNNDIDDLAIRLIRGVRPLTVVVFAIVAGAVIEGVDLRNSTALLTLAVFFATYQLVRWVGVLFSYGVSKIESIHSTSSIQGLKTVIHIVLWASGAIFLLSALGYNVTSIVAGLGIGGVAVALALQTILGDIFSAFSIYFDKPFVVGDYIKTANHEGVVERVGLKTTRIRSLDGEEVVISNTSLTDSVIHNFGNLEQRRVVQEVGIGYKTSRKKIDHLRSALREDLNAVEHVRFERFHLKRFGDSALICELVYFVDSAEFDIYVEAQHKANLTVLHRLATEEISIPFPTITVNQ